jgi:hypothetical protein
MSGRAGADLDDRLVCDLFRLFADRPGIPAEKVQAKLIVTKQSRLIAAA